jgi:glycosyltransferase involved in cell wall biosynthesis
MDMANLALALYLSEQEREVHLVTHRADEELSSRPNVFVHRVPKIANSYFLSSPLIDVAGRRQAAKIFARGGRVLVNGGNCKWGDVNWVHYVHAAYQRQFVGSQLQGLKNHFNSRLDLSDEKKALRQARIIIANSQRTKQDIINNLGVSPERIQVVYYGIDSQLFQPATREEVDAARTKLGWSTDNPVMAFVGALGDRRKGFDTLFAAWKTLCSDPAWDVDLAIIGTGVELDSWKARAAHEGLTARMKFLGFRRDVHEVLKACDALIAPTRYEAYGLGVHEALCCGLPALVTKTAGVAERYPAELQDLLITDPDDADHLVSRLRAWRTRKDEYQLSVAAFSEKLRAISWKDMAEQLVGIIEA